jgi:hypothetical protein
MVPLAPLTSAQILARGVAGLIVVLLVGFVVNVLVLSHLQHAVAQQQVGNVFRDELALGTAPVSEGDFEDVLLDNGTPVALLQIPSIGVSEYVVEGTSSTELRTGPGHRRDTVLPGQAGVSYIMGRAASYGGPFSRLQELAPGQTFTVLTGQGKQTFSVIGVRYAGDPAPPSPTAGQSRLVLESARGPAYIPSGVVRVDADLIGKAEDPGPRMTTYAMLSRSEKSMATDTSTAWALVFALQLFVIAEIAAVWTYRAIGPQKAWIVFAPTLLLAGIFVADQINRFLPNLL